MEDVREQFWDTCCAGSAKTKGLALLVLCFVVQTVLVYSDSTREPPLEGKALAGRRLWHAKNCQACHQFYGYGGFLGPDLTNASTRVTRARLDRLLTQGSGGMPRFDLSRVEIDAVEAFLGAMNRTGRGQARAPGSDRAPRFLDQLDQSLAKEDGAAARGLTLFKGRACSACHVLQGHSPVGAPELSTLGDRLGPAAIQGVLREGRPPRMPAPSLTASERQDMTAFLEWLGSNWAQRADSQVPLSIREIPWWEFK
ncbi:MAG: c-type cytochrome [Planctomycetes bacterium]|nr:c-type cytochrome [Planctomycetota bacterium]